jgi:hypothetical protein
VLRPAGRGAEVVRDGRVLYVIHEPVVGDADSASVPARYEVGLNSIGVVVEHRSVDVQYPLLVDPVVAENYDFRNSNPYPQRG